MKPPKRRRPTAKSTTELKRTNTKLFSLCDKRVCQAFFLKTLNISNGPLNNAFKHKSDFANFFEGSDQRGRHVPSNKLKQDIVDSIVNFLNEKCITELSGKFRKKTICDVDYRSLRNLFNAFKEENGDDNSCPSYTSFKKIFYDNNFSFPHERQKPMKQENSSSGNQCQILEIVKLDNANLNNLEEENNEVEIDENPTPSTVDNQTTNRIIITQNIPDSTSFQQPQVYEIQFVAL